jgi:hypothetical protein
MSLRNKGIIPGVVFSLLTWCLVAGAQAPDALKVPAATSSDGKQATALTDETLLQMLRGMGYEPKVDTNNDGSKSYTIHFEREGWCYYFRISLSPDKSVLWISTSLGDVPPGQKIRPEALLKILELNRSGLGKARFSISDRGTLFLSIPLDNRGVTPALIRDAVDELVANVKETQPYWKTGTWTAEGQEAAAYKTKVEAVYQKVRQAYSEYYQAIAPARNGQPVDRERLEKAHANLLRTIREAKMALKALDVPATPAARQLQDAYVRILERDEALANNEMAEVVKIAVDGKMSASDKSGKINQLLAEVSKKLDEVWKMENQAEDNFRKEYGNI